MAKRARRPPEQLDKQIEVMAEDPARRLADRAAWCSCRSSCACALFSWVAFKLLGSEISYMPSLSVRLHAWMPRWSGALLSLPVILSRPTLA